MTKFVVNCDNFLYDTPMKQKILILIIAFFSLSTLAADIVSTPLGNRLREIFPELRTGYIDLNQNGSMDRLEDMDEQINDFMVKDDQLQVQETLEFIKNNYRYFPVRTLQSVLDALNSPEGTINELIGLNYKASINQLIEKRIAMGDYGLYLPPSAKRKAMMEMSGYLETMNNAYREEGNEAEKRFTSAKDSVYEMLEKGYPLPEPLMEKERAILESTLINTLIREQNNSKAIETSLFTLGRIRSTRAIPYIIPLVSNSLYSVGSIRALGSIGNLEALDLLLNSLQDNPEQTKKVEIIRALGSMGAREALQPLLTILKEENLENQVLNALLESLGKIAEAGNRDRRITTALTEYLNSADPALRISAIKGLSVFNDQKTVSSLIGLFKTERSEAVLATLIDKAASINNNTIIPSLTALLQNPQTSIDLKVSCLHSIGKHREGIKGINGVLNELSSPEPELRKVAYETAKELYHQDSNSLIANLARSVNTNKDPLFQQQAARLFSELPDENALNSLFVMLSSNDPEVKRYSTLAIYRIRPVGNLRITTSLNKIVANETEPLDVRINAVRALGASGYDHPSVNVEETLITIANMRDAKYAQLRYFALKALGQLPSISNETIDKVISIASRERDEVLKEEAIRTISLTGMSDQNRLEKLSLSLESLDPRTQSGLALLYCELLGEVGNDSFIDFSEKLKPYLTSTGEKRRLTYSFYLSGTDEGYKKMILMGSEPGLTDLISSLAESADKERLSRVIKSLKRSETDPAVLELTSIIESELSSSL